MAESTLRTAAPDAAAFPAMFGWPAACAQTWAEMQRAQLDAFDAWQRALTGLGQEFWEEWVAHWAGGVPLEG